LWISLTSNTGVNPIEITQHNNDLPEVLGDSAAFPAGEFQGMTLRTYMATKILCSLMTKTGIDLGNDGGIERAIT